MEDYCIKQFGEKFNEFVKNLNITYEGDSELEEFNKKIHLVLMKKLAKRYVKVLKKYKTQVEQKDSSMFETDIFIFPKVNISRLWKLDVTTEETKEVIWQYLQ